MELKGKHVLVMGTKRSGWAAVELLRRHGAVVRAMDAQALSSEESARFAAIGVPVVAESDENLAEQGGRLPDMLVLSPAIPYDLPLLKHARERGVSTIGEVELASYFLAGPILGITGSNGKTTTTALTGHLLRESGVSCQVGGNIGTPVTSLVASSAVQRWNVLELSSFQLESIKHFHATIAACLNVTPDHLDRHHTLEQYAGAKARLFETQRPGDAAVLNYDDATCRLFAGSTPGRVVWFSATQPVPEGVWLQGETVVWNGLPFLERRAIGLRGLHNVENVMAGVALAHLAGASLESVAAAVTTFPGVEHRIEFVRRFEGVDYFNDSKATNVDAALKAVDAFDGCLWVILGGKDKDSDYRPLRAPLEQRAKAALLIGEPPPYAYAAAPLISKALAGALPLVNCGTLEQAVAYARAQAAPGDTVLLSPACASYDQFQNYEERGNRFKQLVAELF